MSFLNFKSASKKHPSIDSLHKSMFEIKKFWYITMATFFVLVVLFMWIGFRLFSYEYFESYKQEKEEQLPNQIINTTRIKGIIDKRDEMMKKEFEVTRDPSL